MDKVMKTRMEFIAEIKEALSLGVLKPADLQALLPETGKEKVVQHPHEGAVRRPPVGAVFYNIAGILLFAVLLSIIFQTSGDEFYLLHLLLTTGAGLFMWGIVAFLQRRRAAATDATEGLKSSLLVTGVLSVWAGAFIMTAHEMQNTNNASTFFLLFAGFLALAMVFHIIFDVIIKSAILMGMAVFLSVAVVGLVAAQLLSDGNAGFDAWTLTVIAVSGWLAVETRLLTRSVYRERLQPSTFDGVALWVALLAAYVANFGEFGVVWLVALALAVFGLFYLSVVKQKRYFLGTAAFFLVLTLVTISFKYFSDFGVTVSLFFSLVAVLGSAYLTSVLNKRYFQ
jgi:hypothetical protein